MRTTPLLLFFVVAACQPPKLDTQLPAVPGSKNPTAIVKNPQELLRPERPVEDSMPASNDNLLAPHKGSEGETKTGADSQPTEAGEILTVAKGLELTFGQRFFSEPGQQTQLQVTLLDQNGSALSIQKAPIRFSSSRPGDFSVSETGLVTALKADGYSEITAALTGTDIVAKQIFSVNSPIVSRGSGNSASHATQENVNGQIEFQF